MIEVHWGDTVQVQILEMQPQAHGRKITHGGSVKWDGITLAEAVGRWLKMSSEDQSLVTIFGTQTYSASQIGELARRSDFPLRGKPM